MRQRRGEVRPRRLSARVHGRFGAYTEEEYKDHRISAHESRKTRAAFHLAGCRVRKRHPEWLA